VGAATHRALKGKARRTEEDQEILFLALLATHGSERHV